MCPSPQPATADQPPRWNTLGHLLRLCQDYPEISQLGFDTITDFTQHVNYSNPPQCLPAAIHNLLKQALELDDTTTQVCWPALKELAWSQDPHMLNTPDLSALLPIFLTHGGPLGIDICFALQLMIDDGLANASTAPIELFPPTCVCLLTTCSKYSQLADDAPYLAEPSSHEATVFTLVYGPLPMRTISTYWEISCSRNHMAFSI
ncbi:hypothetical protein K439DRAFT_1623634 [Ramaria rubella]|nr:hypothetical protein K439DRAFT_1623634 [Ramaria rubella]